NVTSAGSQGSFYVQGQKLGTTTLTISAPGYTSVTANVTVNPSGFTFAGIGNSTLSTTTFSSPSAINVYPTILDASLNYVTTNVYVSPGLGQVNVPVTSSDTNIGTITLSPVVFNGGDNYKPTTFK